MTLNFEIVLSCRSDIFIHSRNDVGMMQSCKNDPIVKEKQKPLFVCAFISIDK